MKFSVLNVKNSSRIFPGNAVYIEIGKARGPHLRKIALRRDQGIITAKKNLIGPGRLSRHLVNVTLVHKGGGRRIVIDICKKPGVLFLHKFEKEKTTAPVRKDECGSSGGPCHVIVEIKSEWSFTRIFTPDGFVCVGEEHEVFFTAKNGNLLEIVEDKVHIPAGGVNGEFSEAPDTIEEHLFRLLNAPLREKVETGQRQESVRESCSGIEHIIIVTREQFSGAPWKPEHHRPVYAVFIHRLDEHFRRRHFRIGGTVQESEFRLAPKEKVASANDVGRENMSMDVYNQGLRTLRSVLNEVRRPRGGYLPIPGILYPISA